MNTQQTEKNPRNNLSHVKFYQLCDWVTKEHKNHNWGQYSAVAQEATKALGFGIAPVTAKVAYEALGLKPTKKHKKTTVHRDRSQIIAFELATLLRELGKEPSAELLSVVHRKGK